MSHWVALAIFIVVALAVDIKFGGGKTPSLRSSLAWSIIWTVLGLSFTFVVLYTDGSEQSIEYLVGYLIERSLSLDNLFVFAILFTFFGVPAEQRQRLLLYGVLGAIVLRGIFIVIGSAALDAFSWTTYVFGAILLFTAIKIARQDDEHVDPDKTLAMRALRKVFPLTDNYSGGRFFVSEEGKRKATPLFAALIMIGAFDLMFAVDSIPAIFAVTRETFIVFAANAFSLLGMISLYFLLADMLERFRYLSLALAVILAYVSAKLLLVEFWHPNTFLSLGVIVGTLTIAAVASVIVDRKEQQGLTK